MLEENIHAAACANWHSDLRPLAWRELIARLAAMRELRSALAAGHGRAQGSFHSYAARRMGNFGQGEPAVNPYDLGNGKHGAGIVVGLGGLGTTGDRGTE